MNGSPNSSTIRVFIVEDHDAIRRLVADLIRRTPGFLLCGDAASAEAALPQFPDCRPEVVLVDLSLPGMDGLSFIGSLHENQPEILTLAVSGHLESVFAIRALSAGARGYLNKDELIEVVTAVQQVYSGGIYISQNVGAQLNTSPSLLEEHEQQQTTVE